MIAELTIPDEVVIGFFTGVVISQSAAVALLWRRVLELEKMLLDKKP